ncbi:MAG: protease inhibitor I9 family protein [Chloroflexota bacterium]
MATTSPTSTSPQILATVAPEEADVMLQVYLIQLNREWSQSPDQFLEILQQELGRSVEVLHSYETTFLGYAVKLTTQEANQVSTLQNVVSVQTDLKRFPDSTLKHNKSTSP